MCIGDSITDGFGIPGSYRTFFYNGIFKKGQKIKMIGSKSKRNKYIQMSLQEKIFTMMMIILLILDIL